MPKFEPVLRKPGDVIKSEEWNKIQELVSADLEELEEKLLSLKNYVDNMVQTETLQNMTSPEGLSYDLNVVIPGEKTSYDTTVLGLLTKQWLSAKIGIGVICRFGATGNFESFDFWAGAENGDRKALEIELNYLDGTTAVIGGLFVHDRSKLRPKGTDMPYKEYLLSPNENVWYRYSLKNPNPQKEVLSITFKAIDPQCTPRIGNVMHFSSKITPMIVKA